MNGVVSGIREGDVLVLPCGHCASISLRLVIRVGIAAPSCPKCRALTRFHVGHSPEGFRIQSGSGLGWREAAAPDPQVG